MAMGGSANRAVPYINVTPLIDVLLVDVPALLRCKLPEGEQLVSEVLAAIPRTGASVDGAVHS